MNFSDHLELKEWNGQLLLTVRDYELLDYLDDRFTELGIETTHVHQHGSPVCYQLLFQSAVSKAAIWQVLETIGPEQISCIVAVNNGAGGAGPAV